MLFQRLSETGIEWDDPIPLTIYNKWKKFLFGLIDLPSYKIPRYIEGVNLFLETHLFCDVSSEAYGTVAYVRQRLPNGDVQARLLCSKNRVAPTPRNSLSLPRLELMGCLLGAKLCRFLKKTFFFINCKFKFWSDSRVALDWIKGDRQSWKPFVRNRVITITQLTQICDWAILQLGPLPWHREPCRSSFTWRYCGYFEIN